MDDLNIAIKNGYENVKAFYYQNGNGSILTCKDTKKPIKNTIFYVLLFVFIFFFLKPSSNLGWIILAAFTSIICVAQLIDTFIKCRQYIKWKRSVENILDKLQKYESQQLTLTDRTIEISNSDETTIEKWDTIQHTTIKSDSIFLRGNINTSYVFPAKSMEPEQFEELTTFIKEKMRNKLSE